MFFFFLFFFLVSSKDRKLNTSGPLLCHWELPSDAIFTDPGQMSYAYPDDFPVYLFVEFTKATYVRVLFKCQNDFPSSVTLTSAVRVMVRSLKGMYATRDSIFMFWIDANECTCVIVYQSNNAF